MEEEKKEQSNAHSLNIEPDNPDQPDESTQVNPYNPYGKKVEQHMSKAFFTVLGGSLLMFYMGSNYVLGNISPYITSYFELPDQKKANQILPTIIVLDCIFMPFGTYLINREINPKLLIVCGGAISIPFLLIAASTRDFTVFYVFIALAFAIN